MFMLVMTMMVTNSVTKAMLKTTLMTMTNDKIQILTSYLMMQHESPMITIMITSATGMNTMLRKWLRWLWKSSF